MPVPMVYRRQGEGTLATYDFYDLATGIAYKTFYGMTAYLVSTETKTLTTQQLYSSSLFDLVSGGATDMDIDFDLSVEVPMVLKGDAVINVPIGMLSTPNQGVVVTTMTASLYKVVGATETQLGSTATATFSESVAGNTSVWKSFTSKIAVPSTPFASGDKIRLSITATDPIDTSKVIYVFHDPKDRTPVLTPTNITSTKMVINLPIYIQQ